MKKLIQWVLFATLCIPVAAGAQQPDADHLVDHKPLMNRVWETFDQMMYKVTKRDGQTIYTPHFPESLRRLDGKITPGLYDTYRAGSTAYGLPAFRTAHLPVHVLWPERHPANGRSKRRRW